MPEKEGQPPKHRMVVEEIEIPEKSIKTDDDKPDEESIKEPKPDILDEGAKISSQELVDNAPPQIKKEGSPILWILIPGILILGAILGGIMFYLKAVNPSIITSPTPTPVAISSPEPSISPSATPDTSKIAISILNGSGIAGEAAKVKDILVQGGFNVVSTANAATYDYTKTIIKAKSTVDAAILQNIKNLLSKSYVMGDSQTLSSTSTTDIQIVVGSSKAE